MTEDDQEYAIGPGHILVLEPGKTHWGHQACEEDTEIYWVHFVHSLPVRSIEHKSIVWSALIEQGTDQDQAPAIQYAYIPKWAEIELKPLLPILDAMQKIHKQLNTKNVIRLHMLLADLFVQLQAECSRISHPSKTSLISEGILAFLNENWSSPFSSKEMEEVLHFQFDYLTRCLKKHIGMTPLQYVHYLRIQEAQRLLVLTVDSIPEIAEKVGIPDTNYFVRLFRKRTGVPPGLYRQMKQNFV
ncbi:HTH-type transcriptional regulator YesS [compost metagenome]